MEALDRTRGTPRRKSNGLIVLERPPLLERGVREYPDARNARMLRMLVNTHIREMTLDQPRLIRRFRKGGG
jgi:hypothetical protein